MRGGARHPARPRPADGSSDEAFCSEQAAFATTLCATPFGQRLLHLVGSTYVSLADAYLASFAEGVALTIGHEAQRLGSRLSVVGAFAGAASSTHRAMRAEKEKAEADAEASQSELRRVQTAEHAAAAAAALDSPGALAAAMNTTAESLMMGFLALPRHPGIASPLACGLFPLSLECVWCGQLRFALLDYASRCSRCA